MSCSVFNSKLIGGVLLIVGTSIGGGMLALPVSTAEAGIANSMILMIMCWLVMTAGAFLILEVNLRLPAGSNMISMAKSTLGVPGQVVAWVAYLVLLYSLLSAYISGGSDVLNGILHHMHVDLPAWCASLLFTALFGIIVYHGIRTVDYVNRGLMFGKLGVYLLLVIAISPHIQMPSLQVGSMSASMGCLMILAASFGFASIVPSLREYFNDDIRALRLVIWLGSLIPLVCYIVWNIVIIGALQHHGNQDVLTALAHSNHATSGLNDALNDAIHNPWISGCFSFFTSICMVTAFLGVSLGLFDFLADGLKLEKNGRQGKMTLLLTFLPPLVIVLLSPGVYLTALEYAGICCVILLLLMPALMAWRGRSVGGAEQHLFLPGGNAVLSLVILVAFYLLYLACVS
jgi:tyrosine-specific transport protein